MRWLWSLLALLLARGRPRRTEERLVSRTAPDARAERLVGMLLVCAAVCAAAFPVIYGVEAIPRKTQFLGLSLGLALAFVAAALAVVGERLVPHEEEAPEYPPELHEVEDAELVRIVDESGDAISRKWFLLGAGGAAVTALGVAFVTPAASLGPVFEVRRFFETPWRRGVRLVDEDGRPWRADAIEEESFYTAYAEGASKDDLGSPLVVVRLDPAAIQVRRDWAPQGILAFSKVCTHAGCAIAIYRKPSFPALEEKPALVCPCHYSTFDPARGAKVIFGPAGRALPQLPLLVDPKGELRAAGNFSGPVGPSWWGVRNRKPRYGKPTA